MPGSKEKFQLLYEMAAAHDGYFTAKEAKAAGYDTNSHVYHVKAGNWSRELRSIYRLTNYPLPERPDLIQWYLWSQDRLGLAQGVYSHATALSLYELSDVNPAKLHMTVPPGFRRRTPIPAVLVLHVGKVQESEVRQMFGTAVTSPIRTLLDVINEESLASDILVQAVQEARQKGLVTGRELEQERTRCMKLDEILLRIGQ